MPVEDGFGDHAEDAPLLFYAETAFVFGGPPKVVGVAVSGGSDSMALLHLMVHAALATGWQVRAVTVDHRLRPEAAQEAVLVARVCDGLGVPHRVLVWDHGQVAGNVMDAARQARYGLIAAWAVGQGIGHIAVGHTADDQAETFLMGLSRAAGLDGLSGMRPYWTQAGVQFGRPMLNTHRAELRGYLTRHGIPWVEDPTNDAAAFTRTKARRALRALKPLGITVDRLSAVVANLASAQAVVHEAVAQAGRDHVTEIAGGLHFAHRPWATRAHDLQRRLLIAMIRWITGTAHPPREHKLNGLIDALRGRRDATLGGVRFCWQGDRCTVTREARVAGGPVSVGQVWDQRWIVEGPPGEVRALGPKGLPQVKNWRTLGIPRHALMVTPAVWDGDTLLAAPVAGLENGWKARIVAPFHPFPVSD